MEFINGDVADDGDTRPLLTVINVFIDGERAIFNNGGNIPLDG